MATAMSIAARWQSEARRLRREVYALYLACRDPRVPWYAKALAAGIVAYAFSPIDLIPASFRSWGTSMRSCSFRSGCWPCAP
jgi:uncharacterized membrane protein YkvA (DUF1232 family)